MQLRVNPLQLKLGRRVAHTNRRGKITIINVNDHFAYFPVWNCGWSAGWYLMFLLLLLWDLGLAFCFVCVFVCWWRLSFMSQPFAFSFFLFATCVEYWFEKSTHTTHALNTRQQQQNNNNFHSYKFSFSLLLEPPVGFFSFLTFEEIRGK